MQQVHLLVACHGMWGNPDHLSELARHAREKFDDDAQRTAGIEFVVLVAQTNKEAATYDGIDWGGERIADEVQAYIQELEKDGTKKVTRFSVAGYSLGGLLARYLIGILHSRKFFNTVRPVNFTTIATPHIGLPRYPTFFSRLAYKFGPSLLSRTGEQFYSTDSWGTTGKPLLLNMADKNQVFYQALSLFPYVSIYGSAVGDRTVPYATALIQDYDPFINHEAQGISFEVDEKYSALLRSYHVPLEPPPPPPKPKFGTTEFWKSKKPRIFLPPFLRFRFPGNLIVYMMLPVLIPTFFLIAFTRLKLDSSKSRKRIKLMEKDDTNATTERLVHIFHKLEHDVEVAVADLIENGGPVHLGGSDSEDTAFESAGTGLSTPELVASPDLLLSPGPTTPREGEEADLPPDVSAIQHKEDQKHQPLITPVQRQMIAFLNALPQLRKHTAYLPHAFNAHATIVCRDVKQFPQHVDGAPVLRHYVDHFQL